MPTSNVDDSGKVTSIKNMVQEGKIVSLPEELETNLLKGMAVSLTKLRKVLKGNNVSVIRSIVELATENGQHVLLIGELVWLRRARITCQLCQVTTEDHELTWYQCTNCLRNTCLECYQLLKEVKRPQCPHCDGNMFLMPLRCQGCGVSILNLKDLPEKEENACTNCHHELLNVEGKTPPWRRTQIKTQKSKKRAVSSTVSFTNHDISLVMNVHHQKQLSVDGITGTGEMSRPVATTTRRRSRVTPLHSRHQKKRIVLLTKFSDKDEFIKKWIFPHLTKNINNFDPNKHINRHSLRLLKAIPYYFVQYDIFAEFFGAGRVIHRVDAKDKMLALPLSKQQPPLSEKDACKLASEKTFHQKISVSKSKIALDDDTKRTFALKKARARIRDRHSKTVTYTAGNNRKYRRKCQPSNSDIYIHEHYLAYLPIWEFRFQVGEKNPKWHVLQFTETINDIKAVDIDWKKTTHYCTFCQNLVKSLKRCTTCKRRACSDCSIMNSYWKQQKYFCTVKCKAKFDELFNNGSFLEKLTLTWMSAEYVASYVLILLLVIVAWMIWKF